MKIEKAILAWAKGRGYRVAAGTLADLVAVRTTLQKRRDSAEIESAFFGDHLEVFNYLEGTTLQNPRSILLVAVPRPAHILSFTVGGRKIETILPPTYVHYRGLFQDVRSDFATAVAGHDCHVELLSAPLKALGNQLGLLSYGRNNIGYIKGLGSYFQLVGLLLDKKIEKKSFLKKPAEKLLPRCRECRICVKACPTGAIDKERVLLHAEKCYTLFSESPDPIPEGLKSPSPKCLIGCLRCQQVCPENKGMLKYEEAAVSFDEAETAAFLGLDGESAQTVERTCAKFQKLGLTEKHPLFARNLERWLHLWRFAIPDKQSEPNPCGS